MGKIAALLAAAMLIGGMNIACAEPLKLTADDMDSIDAGYTLRLNVSTFGSASGLFAVSGSSSAAAVDGTARTAATVWFNFISH